MKVKFTIWILVVSSCLPSGRAEEIYRKTLPSGGVVSGELKIDQTEVTFTTYPDPKDRTIHGPASKALVPRDNYTVTFRGNNQTVTVFSYQLVMAIPLTPSGPVFKILGSDIIGNTVYVSFIEKGTSKILRFRIESGEADIKSVQTTDLKQQQFDVYPPSFTVENGVPCLNQNIPPSDRLRRPKIPLSTVKWVDPSDPSAKK